MLQNDSKRLGVLTSGGDASGMNAAVRSVVRTALDFGLEVFAIYEGYQGLMDGGDNFRKLDWNLVGGILHRGGTIIGTTRSPAFHHREGRLQAACHLLEYGINNLVVIGGDGSLKGAQIFQQEWPSLLTELVEKGMVNQERVDLYPTLTVAGLVGSIDNDMCGTDMTIGADTALHRITDAIDAITSTAASHQRSFVVEVMGRHCGYLALMGALASGADWVLIPENPPHFDDWEDRMCEVLRTGREIGRRDSIVVVAEGAQDRHGNPITGQYVQQVLEERMGEEARLTILGYVQRGGPPTAFDRNLSAILGYSAVEYILSNGEDGAAHLIGIRGNRITRTPLTNCVQQNHDLVKAIDDKLYEAAMEMRGESFEDTFRINRTLVRATPRPPKPGQNRYRLAVIHSGAPAPGMNTAVRAAVRLGVDQGHEMFGVRNGFAGLIAGEIQPMGWMDVNSWSQVGGAELGTNRKIPADGEFYSIARMLEKHQIQGLLIIGGWTGYLAAHDLHRNRHLFPALNIPIVCLPATIDNDLPGSELSIGADTALNNIMSAVDNIKQSAVASKRCFVVEVMGRNCGYLALMSGIATGAERVYIPEEGVTLQELQGDLRNLVTGFKSGKRLGLIIRNERVNPLYTTEFMSALFEEEGEGLFDVRQAILGHLQQGGDPTPFDRIQANRLASKCVDYLILEARKLSPRSAFVGMQAGRIKFNDMKNLPEMVESDFQRPKEQWWLELRKIARLLAQPAPLSYSVLIV